MWGGINSNYIWTTAFYLLGNMLLSLLHDSSSVDSSMVVWGFFPRIKGWKFNVQHNSLGGMPSSWTHICLENSSLLNQLILIMKCLKLWDIALLFYKFFLGILSSSIGWFCIKTFTMLLYLVVSRVVSHIFQPFIHYPASSNLA